MRQMTAMFQRKKAADCHLLYICSCSTLARLFTAYQHD